MSNKIQVESIEALSHLDLVLGKFCEDVSDRISSAQRVVANRLSWIEDNCQQLEQKAAYWEEQYYDADSEEDDVGYYAHKRDEAIEKLSQARNLQRQVMETAENLSSSIRRVKKIVDGGQLDEARSFIRQKADQLNNYVSIQQVTGLFEAAGISDFVISETSSVQDKTKVSKMLRQLEIIKNEAKSEWLEKTEGSERTRFGLDFGQFAHKRYQAKIIEWENQCGRTQRSKENPNGEYGIEYHIESLTDNKSAYFDYVDFDWNVIIDYKSAKEGQTLGEVEKKNKKQKEKHIRIYKEHFGITPKYYYETYPSTKDMYNNK
jgi:hypothetical protein